MKTLVMVEIGDDVTNVIVENPDNLTEIAKAWKKEHKKYGIAMPEWIGRLMKIKIMRPREHYKYLNPIVFLKKARLIR